MVKDEQVEAAFSYVGDSPLVRVDESGNGVYYLTDALGSVIGLVDGNGEKIADFPKISRANSLSREKKEVGEWGSGK